MDPATHQIHVRDTGAQFPCGEGSFVLEGMKRAGCGPVHYGCFGGGCGVCKMRIVSGDYQILKKMSRAHISEEEESNGIVLLCCVKPRGDLVLSSV